MRYYSLLVNSKTISLAQNHLRTFFPTVSYSDLEAAIFAGLAIRNKAAFSKLRTNVPIGEFRHIYFNAEAMAENLVNAGYTLDQMQLKKVQNLDFPREIAIDFVVVTSGTLFSERHPGDLDVKTSSFCSRADVELCKLVLSRVREVRKSSGARTSYGYKHDIENTFSTYIPNGAVIQAGLELGLKLDFCSSGINVSFYFEDEAFKEALRAVVYVFSSRQVNIREPFTKQLMPRGHKTI